MIRSDDAVEMVDGVKLQHAAQVRAELAAAEADYAAGEFGRPWPHTLSDDEWRAHVDEYGVPGASDARRAYDVAAP